MRLPAITWFVSPAFAPFKPPAALLPAGKVSDISSSDRTHLQPGGQDLQEARASSGGLLPHGPHLHLHGLRRGRAQVPRHRLHRPRVEEEDGELRPLFVE